MTYNPERKLLHKREQTPQTLEEIAKSMGLTRERVRQIEFRALLKLRRILTKHGYKLDDFIPD